MSKIYGFLSNVFFMISILSIFLQFFSDYFSQLIAPMIFLTVMTLLLNEKFKSKDMKLLTLILILLVLNFFISVIFQGNQMTIALRFLIILLLIPLSIIVKPKAYFIRCFLIILFVFMVFLLSLEIYYYKSPGLWITDRIAWRSRGIGDVYTFNNFFYRIQIKGNALIPIGFFLFYYTYYGKFKKLMCCFYFIILLIAGNTMYLISVATFLLLDAILVRKFFLTKISLKKLLVVLTIPIGIVLFIINIVTNLARKGETSWPVRVDQLKILLKNMESSIFTILFGKGLGNVLPSGSVTFYRDYSENIYFELQAVYIYNQLGLINFVIYFFSILKLIVSNWRTREVYICLVSYLVYAISNPYIFDTTNVIAFLLLSTLEIQKKVKYEKE